MKKLFFLLLMIFSLGAQGQTKVSDLFRTMPDSLMPLLSTNNRLDFIDYLENNMQARVRNRFEEYAEMDSLTDSYLHIQMTEVSEVEVKLLPLAGDSVLICVIRTFAGPAKESSVEFYDQYWNRQNWVELPTLRVADYFMVVPDSMAEEMEQVKAELADMPLVAVSADARKPILTMTLQTVELSRGSKEKVADYVRPIQFIWNGEAFVKKN